LPFGTQAALPHLIRTGGGSIVCVGTRAALQPFSGAAGYVASKAAVIGMTKVWARELGPKGITVNAVNPGPTDTGWGLGDQDPTDAMPFGRWGDPDDAARLIAWLCTDEARWLTGQVIDSEGGFRRGR